MRKIILLLSAILLFPIASLAGTGDKAFNKVIAAYNAAKGISVSYSILTSDGNYSGTIVMQDNKFRINSADIICWFDGKTQWSYSTISREVNIMQPTADELQIVNPFAIISNLKTAYNATALKPASSTLSELQLTPKKGNNTDIKSVLLSVDTRTNLPVKIVLTMNDKTQMFVTLSGYTTGKNYPAATFTYDKRMVPAGTPVVDLR